MLIRFKRNAQGLFHLAEYYAMKLLPQSLVICLLSAALSSAGCATGRNMTSKYYLPEWENKILNFPDPSETSGGYWAAKAAHQVSHAIGKILLLPFAFVGNVILNAYYIPTWPFRWLLRGDKRLVVWHPIFKIGDDTGSEYYSKAWNRDLH